MKFVRTSGSPAVGPRVGLVTSAYAFLFDGNPPGDAHGRVFLPDLRSFASHLDTLKISRQRRAPISSMHWLFLGSRQNLDSRDTYVLRVAHADRSSGRTPTTLGIKPLVPVIISAVRARAERPFGSAYIHMSSLAGPQMTLISSFAELRRYHEATTVS